MICLDRYDCIRMVLNCMTRDTHEGSWFQHGVGGLRSSWLACIEGVIGCLGEQYGVI
jgi:hypothetical protein